MIAAAFAGSIRRKAVWVWAITAVAVVGLPRVATADASAVVTRGSVAHVVIVSVPDLTWDRVDRDRVPSLVDRLEGSTIGSMSLQSARRGRPDAADMFVTLSAGTRSLRDRNAPACNSVAPVGLSCGAAAVIQSNDRELYGAEPFAFGEALAERGIRRYYIGNCRTGCDAPLAIADRNGRFDATYGSVAEVLRDESGRASVTMVDVGSTSDFERLLQSPHRRLFDEATMLIVLSPTTRGSAPSLSLLAIRSSAFGVGYARSATTGRLPIVQMIDVAPTVLRALAIERPDSMEGRALTSEARSDSLASAAARLREVNRDARLRDRMIGGGVATLATLELIVISLLFLLLAARRLLPNVAWLQHRGCNRVLAHIAVVAGAYVPATLLVNFFPLSTSGHWVFWPTLAAVTFMVAAVAWIPVRSQRNPVVGVSAITAAVLLIDGVTGTHLSYNSIFGFSATGGDRFVGYGNSTFAFLAVAAFVVAASLPKRSVAVTALAIVGLVVAAPTFGADIGGAVTMMAALLCFVVVGYGFRLSSVRGVSALVGIAIAGITIGVVDAARNAESQSHLGRFITSITAQGGGEFSMVLHRKWNAAQHELAHSVATFTVPLVIVIALVIWQITPDAIRAAVRSHRVWRGAAGAIAIVAFMGSVVNDSGINVAMAAFAIAVPTMVWMLTTIDERVAFAEEAVA